MLFDLCVLWALKQHHDSAAHLEHTHFFALTQENTLVRDCVSPLNPRLSRRGLELAEELLLGLDVLLCLLEAVESVECQLAFQTCLELKLTVGSGSEVFQIEFSEQTVDRVKFFCLRLAFGLGVRPKERVAAIALSHGGVVPVLNTVTCRFGLVRP